MKRIHNRDTSSQARVKSTVEETTEIDPLKSESLIVEESLDTEID